MNILSDSGFEIVRDALSALDCRRLLEALSSPTVLGTRAGARHLLQVPSIAELARDPRLHRLAADALGSGAVAFRATYFHKARHANWAVTWHQDTALPLRNRFDAAGWGPWSRKAGIHYAHAPTEALEEVVAIRVHLDDSLHDNGPLRVIPGSHRLGVLTDDQVAEIAHAEPSTECIVPHGGILLMCPLLIHASSKSTDPTKPRRVLHIEYASSLQLAHGIELAAA